jgi:hypothetical protein
MHHCIRHRTFLHAAFDVCLLLLLLLLLERDMELHTYLRCSADFARTFIHKCDFLRIAQAHGAPYVLITEHLLLLVCAHVESNVTLGARDWSLLYQTQENVQQT